MISPGLSAIMLYKSSSYNALQKVVPKRVTHSIVKTSVDDSKVQKIDTSEFMAMKRAGLPGTCTHGCIQGEAKEPNEP